MIKLRDFLQNTAILREIQFFNGRGMIYTPLTYTLLAYKVYSMPFYTVVEIANFIREADAIMDDAQRMAIIDRIAENPLRGDSITAGVRRVRFGNYRVWYQWRGGENNRVFLIDVYTKSQKSNLSEAEVKEVRRIGKNLAKD